MSMSLNHNGQSFVCPRVTPKSPTPSLFFFYPFLSISKFEQKSYLCEVVLSRMAAKQSHLATVHSPLQHFRHLFQFTACLTSAGWILLTQVYVSWTGKGSLPRHKGSPPPPTPLHVISLLRLERATMS